MKKQTRGPARRSAEGLQEVVRGKGARYDAKAVNACLNLFRKKHFEFK